MLKKRPADEVDPDKVEMLKKAAIPPGTPLVPEADVTLAEVYAARPELKVGAVPPPSRTDE